MHRTKSPIIHFFTIFVLVNFSLAYFSSIANNSFGIPVRNFPIVNIKPFTIEDISTYNNDLEYFNNIHKVLSDFVDKEIISKDKPAIVGNVYGTQMLVNLNSFTEEVFDVEDSTNSNINYQRDISDSVLKEINKIRIDNGLTKLNYSQSAVNMAEDHSLQMSMIEGLVGHSDLIYRQQIFGVIPPGTIGAENEAYFTTSSASFVVNQWMASQIHHDNILNASFIKAGVGVVEKNNVFYYTIEFSN